MTHTHTQEYPRGIKRPLGRPPIRWKDDITKKLGNTWQRKARSRSEWKRIVASNVANTAFQGMRNSTVLVFIHQWQ
ncbi:unnamed protein product [Anisakis simplex]|uniref:Endonuclease-reverse transcriptase n=1 Tax=Anisakis simplex TaxID=6269 RepID=A0A0M3JDY5_ANISI|nr:unnamed protein product [Anisakis simplex]